MDAALRQWKIAGPEVVRLPNKYEKCHSISPEIDIGKHHEDYPAFQKMFFTDVNNLFNCFKDICNPFEEDELTVLGTGEIMTPEIQSWLGNLLEMNEEKYQNFRKHRLIICDVAITATIKNNALNLPSTFDSADDKACIRKIKEKKAEKFAKAAYLSFSYRDSIVKEYFQYEVTEFPSSFTDGGKMYHSKNQIY